MTRLAYVKNTSATASACFIIFDTLVPADADRSILPYEARSTRRLTTDQNCSQGPTTLVIKFGEHLASPVDESPLRLLPNFMTSLRWRKMNSASSTSTSSRCYARTDVLTRCDSRLMRFKICAPASSKSNFPILTIFLNFKIYRFADFMDLTFCVMAVCSILTRSPQSARSLGSVLRVSRRLCCGRFGRHALTLRSRCLGLALTSTPCGRSFRSRSHSMLAEF